MNLRNFVTCTQCMRELQPTYQKEIENAMIHNYHCEHCCYSFSIYSITKTRLVEMSGKELNLDALVTTTIGEALGWEILQPHQWEQHEMEDK